MASTNQNINPRPCVYNCGIQIYWNTSVNEYWEVFTKKKHICPNRTRNTSTNTATTADSGITPPSNSPKPRYYNPSARKRTPYASSFASASKPKMSNSFELLTGPIDTYKRNTRYYQTSCQIIMARSMDPNLILLQIIFS